MTEERIQKLMQRALDNELSTESERELSLILDDDPQEAERFDKLQRVDDMLRAAPHERAPERLALTIMARLAQAMERKQQMGELDMAMMQVALSTVTVATLPLLLGASHMLLNAKSKPESVEAVLEQVAGLLILTMDTMEVMLDEAEAAFEENPEAAIALVTMIPATLLTLVRTILENQDKLEP